MTRPACTSAFGSARPSALTALLVACALALGAALTGCQPSGDAASGDAASEPAGSAEASSAAASSAAASSAADTADWTVLFDGESLSGWRNPYDWGTARVAGGAIELRADEKFFLVTERAYDDFVFEGEVRVPDRESNSGFMFRAQVDTNRVYGYQAEVDPSERAWSGGLYDEGRRGWLNPPAGDSAAGATFRQERGDAFDPTGWNEYRIRAVGDSLQIWVNGQQATAYRDTVDSEGVIGIQHHGEDGKVYRFRDLRIREVQSGA